MEKPIVFLSHSSKDKVQLAALKDLLDKRAAGSLEFFLSSDGQSIRFGRNWVVRISDALKRSKLMFVFLSPESADSKWIHFEAGCAYAQDIQVVPVCLPGMDLNRMSPPLNLLQGFNLHSHEAIANIARTCNEVFQLKINENYCIDDFQLLFSDYGRKEQSYFGEYEWAVREISLRMLNHTKPEGVFYPIDKLVEISKERDVPLSFIHRKDVGVGEAAEIELSGCVINVKSEARSKGSRGVLEGTHESNYHEIFCQMAPKLFHINAPILDDWFREAAFPATFEVKVKLKSGIIMERSRFEITSLLYKTGIEPAGKFELKFGEFTFRLNEGESAVRLEFSDSGGLATTPLKELLTALFEKEVLFEDPTGVPIR